MQAKISNPTTHHFTPNPILTNAISCWHGIDMRFFLRIFTVLG